VIKNVIKDVLLNDPNSKALILKDYDESSSKVKVFRLKQSLDDPTLLFWRPFNLKNGEWQFIFFLKLAEGMLLPNTDFGQAI